MEKVHYFKKNGFNGATVIRGIYGYGKKSQLHSAGLVKISEKKISGFYKFNAIL